jgi:uroporphyrinogen decarboxylase
MMTGRERVIKALKREEPDRVPTFEWIIHPKVIRGLTGQDSEMEFIRRMGLDGIAVGTDVKKETVDDRHFRDEWGIVRVSYDEYPNAVQFPVSTEKDLETLSIPDPDAEYRFDSIKKAMRELDGGKAVIIRLRDVFSQPRDLMGFENFLMGFYTQPDLVTRLMEISVDYNARLAKNAREIGGEIIVVGDDIADTSSLLLSPELYREVVLPHFARLIRTFKELGFYVIKHTDGNITEVIGDIIGTGVDCLDPIDPSAGLDIGEIKQAYGSRVCLKGNVDCVKTLTEKPPEAVVAETRECILKAAVGGGHIISSSNSLHAGVKPENYRAFLEALEEYGHYPLDLDKLKSPSP